MREHAGPSGELADWDAFAESWNDARARRPHGRRRALPPAAPRDVTRSRAGAPRSVRQPHQPHFQAIDYNPLNGGIERWFEPVADDDRQRARACRPSCASAGRSSAASRPAVGGWHIEVHQFRIEARPGEQGRPTPEGLHRDGVDYVLVLLVDRRNIASGMTTIHALDGRDARPLHADRAVRRRARGRHARRARRHAGRSRSTPARPRYRDVLVVTFRQNSRT